MRFLFGIIIGTVLTLFIATAVDAPTSPAVSNSLERLERLWDGLINNTARTLFKSTDSEAVDEIRARADELLAAVPGRFTASTPAMTPIEKPDPPEADSPEGPASAFPPSAEFDSLAQTETPAQIEPPTPVDSLTPITSPTLFDSLTPLTDRRQPRTLSDPELSAIVPERMVAAEPGITATAPVWVPFHSQMSAEGFADRLTRELEHPFKVQRQGPGAYQVVFETRNPLARDLLLAQVREITGQ